MADFFPENILERSLYQRLEKDKKQSGSPQQKEIAYMTEQEFLRLGIGTVVSGRLKENIYFVIDDIDQLGTAYKGKKYVVYGAKQIDCETNYIRIDIGNCKLWKIEGRIK